MSTLSLNIKRSLELLTEMHNISEAELCRKTNISQPTLNRLFSGATDDPRASTLEVIAKFFNVTVDQLLGNQPITNTKKTSLASATYLPVLSWDNANKWPELLSKIKSNSWTKWLEVESSINKRCFCAEVIGDSMWPQFIEGTLLIIDPTTKPKNRDFVIAYLRKENRTVFRKYIFDGKDRSLQPVNSAYPSILMSTADKIQGVVIQARNTFKE